MRLALVLPGVAIGFVAVVILGPGNARPVLGARVHVAAPREDRLHRSARLTAAWRLGDTETPADDLPIEVRSGTVTARATTGRDGVAELALAEPVRDGSPLLVTSGAAVIAEGTLHVDATAQIVEAPPIAATRRGELPIDVRVVRGQLAPPFPDRVVVSAKITGDPLAHRRARVTVLLTGGSPDRQEGELDAGAPAFGFDVRPDALRVDVDVEAREEDPSSWEASLPTVPGAIWLDPKSPADRFDLVAPAPRKAAYVSYVTRRGRIGGAVVPLTEDAAGFYRGSVTRPAVAEPPFDVVVAGDPEEQGVATVVWPVLRDDASAASLHWVAGTPEATRPLRLERVIDGMPASLAAEQARIRRVRGIAIGVALLVGIVEVLLLVREGRRAQSDLDAHFAAQADAADGAEGAAEIRHVARSAAKSGHVMVTVLGAMVALAFGIVAAFVIAR